MNNNPEFRAAWSVVPDVVHAETQLRKLEERLKTLGNVQSPDAARRKVFDDATAALRDGADFPDHIGKRGADAYRDALEASSEAMGLQVGITSIRGHLEYLRISDGAETALEALGKRLKEFLAEVKKPAADLKGARSAEEAIAAGGNAPDAWRLLTSMLGTLRNIRAAQFEILKGLGDGHRLQTLRLKGHFEAAGITPGSVPDDVLHAMTSGQYTVPYLVYISDLPNVWVPTSFEELEAEDIVDAGTPDDSVVDYSPHVTQISPPPAPALTGAEHTPVIALR
ncbi:hypothetical protein ACFXGI_10750 [Streptomyces sp. NPDC059355]|uniref:hypothetical protein n=1 Tax=Streptomyces sp. NPDC059355 TaxID=3346811 RepID=UPI0036BF5206